MFVAEFEKILQEGISECKQPTALAAGSDSKPKRRRRRRNAERDAIIFSCLERDEDREEICSILDKKGIETTPQMRKYKVNRWTAAWKDPEFQNNVQQLFAKVKSRHSRVKS